MRKIILISDHPSKVLENVEFSKDFSKQNLPVELGGDLDANLLNEISFGDGNGEEIYSCYENFNRRNDE